MAGFVTVARVGDLEDGEARRVTVAGRAIALYNVEGAYYATDDTCTHARASLSEGELDGPAVHCPLHGARFDVRTGRVLSPPAFRPVKTVPVRVTGDEIQVEV